MAGSCSPFTPTVPKKRRGRKTYLNARALRIFLRPAKLREIKKLCQPGRLHRDQLRPGNRADISPVRYAGNLDGKKGEAMSIWTILFVILLIAWIGGSQSSLWSDDHPDDSFIHRIHKGFCLF